MDCLLFLGQSRNTRCLLYKQSAEYIDHIFFRCSFSSWIWRFILGRFNSKRKPLESLLAEESWIRSKFRGKGQSTIATKIAFSASIYCIWMERNKRVFDHKEQHKQSILRHILSFVKVKMIFLKLQDSPSDRNIEISKNLGISYQFQDIQPKQCKWEPPDCNSHKLNSDASLTADKATLGGLIRDSSGTSILMYSLDATIQNITDLELDAIAHGLSMASATSVQNSWVETDYLLADQIIKGEIRCPWRKLNTLDNVLNLLRSFSS
ncbi:uncharacterized protein LOC143891727 [Tasmannia lanceolata]|uniref:uncharacterized protein LOC143891727 n=1 Tax=Tasmannia lanceolata TaxID=3420 RepID=UPI0040638233